MNDEQKSFPTSHPADRAIAEAAAVAPLSATETAERLGPVLVASGEGTPGHIQQLLESPTQRATLVRLWDVEPPTWPLLARAVLHDPGLVEVIEQVYIPTDSAGARQTATMLDGLRTMTVSRVAVVGDAVAARHIDLAPAGTVAAHSATPDASPAEPGTPEEVAEALDVALVGSPPVARVRGSSRYAGERIALLVRSRGGDDEVVGPHRLDRAADGRAAGDYALSLADIAEVVVLVLAR